MMGLAEGELDAACILCARGADAAEAGRVLKRLPCECIACEACTAGWLTWEGRRGEEGGEGARRCWMGHDLPAEATAALSEVASSYVESLPTASAEDAAAWLGRAVLLPEGDLSNLSSGERIGVEDGGARVLTATLTVRGPAGETTAVPVAVKALQVNNARRMAREVGTAMRASLQCPRACKVYGCVRRGGEVWLVMERCAGSLEGRLRELEGAGLPTAELARVARDVCASLAELHECGVVHCDIKPANCLVREDGTVILADFGGSKPMDRTAQSTLTHTAPYASLDQLSAMRGVRPDPRWDVWSVGATLVHLATGKMPFESVAKNMIAVEHAYDRAMQHMHLDEVPKRIRPILARCLDKNPAGRPTAAVLVDEMRRWEEDVRLAAQPAAPEVATLTEEGLQHVRDHMMLPEESLSGLGRELGRARYTVSEASLTTGSKVDPVAVKVMLDKDNTRFEVAVSMWASHHCKHVCRTHGAVVRDDKLLMVMERCKGSLGDVLERGELLTQGELARAAQDICAAVAELHACGIVHCDIKPANSFVRKDGTVVLGSFGSAKTSWDVYAVGATLAHLATGKRPFESINANLIAVEHVSGRALQQRHLDEVPGALRPILVQCLDADPRKRPTIQELTQMLEPWVKSVRQQEQVGPGPPSDHASTSTIPGSLVAALELADSATVVDTLRTIARGEVTLTEVQRQELLRRVTLPEPSVLSSLGPQLGRGQYLVREATLTTGGKVEPVAVKIMLENDAHLAEVVLSKRLSAVCKMVCKAHGAARKDGKLLLVMERCTGSLTDMLRERDGPVTQAELAMAAQDICAAVAELHACGIVHCDIKPANCLVRENGTVVLCDFGSAKGMAADVQLPMGMTYAYAPMDQMANNDPSQPDKAWDVYAVAATLAHLATGKRPFEGIGPHVISVEHHKGRALQHRHLEEVPDALRLILTQCLDADPRKRPTIQELTQMLEPWVQSVG